MNVDSLLHLAAENGFSQYAEIKIETLEPRPEVRQMCEANTCGRYARSWSCPPACGTLEQCREMICACDTGVLVQTVAELEDPLDGEGMMEAEKLHKERFDRMYCDLLSKKAEVLALGAGSCTKCDFCTYPDAPCRFPDSLTVSMESFGLMVTDVCRANGMKYYYGPGTIAYTSCFLVRRTL